MIVRLKELRLKNHLDLGKSSKKSLILFCLPRSGSTPVAICLGHYYQQQNDATNLMEFFHAGLPLPNAEAKSWPDEVSKKSEAAKIGNANQFPGAIDMVRSKKLNLLLKAKRNFVLKVFPLQLSESSLKELSVKFDIVALRRDPWKNFLSYCISRATGIWYQDQKLEIKKSSVTVKQEYVDDFFEIFISFNRTVQSLKLPVLDFERFESMPVEDFVKSLGLTKDFDSKQVHLSQIQNGELREERIANLNQVKMWYEAAIQDAIGAIQSNGN